MNNRFLNIFDMTEEEAITLLDTPTDRLQEDDMRYVAASHLVNFSTDRAKEALIRAVLRDEPSLDNRIVRRKAVESLGRLEVKAAIPLMVDCLEDSDTYLVENCVWAMGEMKVEEPEILNKITQLLSQEKQSYRVILQTLRKLEHRSALPQISSFTNHPDPTITSAAISAIAYLTQDFTSLEQVMNLLVHSNPMVRRLSIQDLIDCEFADAIPMIARCPVSQVFRLRGIRLLATARSWEFSRYQTHLEQCLMDHPDHLQLIHSYSSLSTLSDLIHELYDTDFGKCYLATSTILKHYSEVAPSALFATYADSAHADYGAHFHVMKLMGWLKHLPAYDLLIEALQNPQPQFQKSRSAAAISLGELGDARAVPELTKCLMATNWELKYTAMLALDRLGHRAGLETLTNDRDEAVSGKAKLVCGASARS